MNWEQGRYPCKVGGRDSLLLGVKVGSQTKGSVLQGRLSSCPRSWIQKLETHFVPERTGQAAWRVISSPSPLRKRLYQNAAVPFFGQSARPRCGKTVAPPCSTSDS